MMCLAAYIMQNKSNTVSRVSSERHSTEKRKEKVLENENLSPDAIRNEYVRARTHVGIVARETSSVIKVKIKSIKVSEGKSKLCSRLNSRSFAVGPRVSVINEFRSESRFEWPA